MNTMYWLVQLFIPRRRHIFTLIRRAISNSFIPCNVARIPDASIPHATLGNRGCVLGGFPVAQKKQRGGGEEEQRRGVGWEGLWRAAGMRARAMVP